MIMSHVTMTFILLSSHPVTKSPCCMSSLKNGCRPVVFKGQGPNPPYVQCTVCIFTKIGLQIKVGPGSTVRSIFYIT